MDTLLETLIARGFRGPNKSASNTPLLSRDSAIPGWFNLVSFPSNANQDKGVYVSVVTSGCGDILARWVAPDADAIEAFLDRAERILSEWDSMEVTFNAPVNA